MTRRIPFGIRQDRWHQWLCGVFVSAAIVATGCGSDRPDEPDAQTSGSAADTAAPIDPCTLVTAAEAESALGAPVGEPERPKEANIPPMLSACRYIAPRGAGVAVLTVMVRMGWSENEARVGFAGTKEQFPQAQTFAGLGDDAFAVGDQLHVLHGRAHLTIAGNIATDAARALAATAVSRLK